MLAASKNLLRPRASRAPVTQIEIFFDLVFAFAVTQLSETLRENLTVLGGVQVLMLFAAIWWVWVYTSWATNWLNPDEPPVRLLLIALMLLGLALSTSLPDAFGERGLVFAVAYAGMQVGRDLFMMWATFRHDPANFRNMRRITFWQAASGGFWLLGGFLPEQRLGFWAAALAADVASPAFGFAVPGLGRSTTAEWIIDSRHLAERCAGFIFIALGETVADSGATFYHLIWTAPNITAFIVAFVEIVTLWWIYFDKAAERTADAFAKSADPGAIARAAYTYAHGLLVAGIIGAAAADAIDLAHPESGFMPAAAALTLGGPAVYLLGNGVFRKLLARRFPPSHKIGLAVLAALGIAAPLFSTLALAASTAATLIGVTILAELLHQRQVAKS
jgi:low temperature requirement protein LtrA